MEITISAEEFETKCLELVDEVYENGLTVIITKDGRPFVKLGPIPVEAELPDEMGGHGPVEEVAPSQLEDSGDAPKRTTRTGDLTS